MTVYRATATLATAALADGAVLLQSDVASCRLEGESAQLVAERILPMLETWKSLDAIMERVPDYAADDVERLLRGLVGSRLIVSRSAAPAFPPASAAARLLADLGLDEVAVGEQLARLRIGVIGATAQAEAIRRELETAGVGAVSRFDQTDDSAPDAGSTRQPLSKQAIAEAAGELDLMIVAVDRAFLAARHWANQAALASGCPAIFLDIGATEAVVGPTVLPGESGCYMCFRMRRIATRDAFAEAMAHERHLDSLRSLEAERASFPGLAQMAIGAVLGEAFRVLFGPLMPALPNTVLRIDALTGAFEHHHVLRQPECPHCRSIDTAVRTRAD